MIIIVLISYMNQYFSTVSADLELQIRIQILKTI